MRLRLLLTPVWLALLVLVWWWSNRPVDAGPTPPVARIESVSFAPFRAGQSPVSGRFPTAAQVDADVALLAPSVANLRTYAAIEGDYDVAALAGRHGLTVWQGIWLGGDRAQNAREMARGIALAHAHPETITRLIVGNEVLLRRDLPVEELIADIDRVRAAVKQPVTYADVWEFWRQFPQVAAHVDRVTIHLLPYWEDVPTGIDRAVDHVVETWRLMAALFPGKPVTIGETGWPSHGRARADAVPGVVNQTMFLRRFMTEAGKNGLDYNLIEAFDQGWKARDEGTVGAYWGLWTQARQQRFSLAGKVTENAAWPIGAALSCGFAVALMCLRFRPALSAALGLAWGFAATAQWAECFSPAEYLALAGNLMGQTILALLLVHGPVSAARTGADATQTVRRALALRWRALVPIRIWLFDDLLFVFLWTASVQQMLLLLDPRYRDFPVASFVVPLLCTCLRALQRELPVDGGGRAEIALGATLALSAVAAAVREGPLNHQSLLWTACALVLATPPLLRCVRPAWSLRRA